MILKRLTLSNYKQHSSLDRTFTGNVIGIIGNNGVGKSNLLGAMHFAFAGEQPGFNRSDLLKWGTASGGVDLYFSHNGLEGHIYRSLNTSEATFVYGKDRYTGIAKVAAAITEHLGMDKDLLKQTVFVRQAELDNVLFTDPRIRELSFQKLCGIGEAAKINKQLGDILGTLSTPPNYDEQIAEGTLRQSQLQAKVDELRTTHAEISGLRAKLPAARDLQSQLANLNHARSSCTRLKALATDVAKYRDRLAVNQAALAALPGIDASLADIDADIEKTRASIAAAEQYGRALGNWETLGKQLMGLGDAPVATPQPYTQTQIDSLRTQFTSVRDAYTNVMGQLKLYTGVMTAVSACGITAGTPCPVCGHAIENTDHLKEQIKQLETDARTFDPRKLESDLNLAFERNRTHESQVMTAVTRYKSMFEVMAAKYAEAERAVDSLKEYKALSESLQSLRLRVQNLMVSRQAKIDLTTRRTQLTAGIHADTGYLADAQKALDTEKQGLTGYACDTDEQLAAAVNAVDVQIRSVTAGINELRGIDDQLSQLTGMLTATEGSLTDLQKTLKDLEDRRAGQGNYNKVVATLTAVRDWFHYGNGPHTLANSVLTSMTADVNNFLEKFSAPFVVMPGDEALGFKYALTDGGAMPEGYPDASHLSGGQKVQLAISFRFASYAMFANKIGLLSLDEPLAYLDERNVGNFCVLLGTAIRDLAQKMGLQILITTHHKEILAHCDSVIDLNAKQ